MMEKEVYLNNAMYQIPRILSLEDRDFSSLTCGCFDRTYWAWKFKDFSDVTLQRSVYLLSIVYSNNFNGNIYFKNENIKEWIKAGILYWFKIQHKNGSFDQAFPNEFSFGATAFTLHPLIKSLSAIEKCFSTKEKEIIYNTFERSARFLVRNSEVHGFISNHLAGGALSLYNVGVLLNKEIYKKHSRKLIDLILKNQSKEGWFKEYDGPDPGYETLGIYYLAKYYQETQDENVLKALERSINFLSYFLHPDGTFGGEYGSRNTEIFYPAGFEILRNKIPLARKISDKMRGFIFKNKTISLRSVDKENLIPLVENYLEAYLASGETEPTKEILLPFERKEEDKFFKLSGIYIKSSCNYYAICNTKKGGILKIFDKAEKKIAWNDVGYVGEIKNGNLLTTQISNSKTKIIFNDDSIDIATNFMKVSRKVLTPFKLIILRIFGFTICKNIFIGNLFKKNIVKMLITQKSNYPVRLARKVIFQKEKVEIQDVLTKNKGVKFKWLEYGKKFSAIHMGSAKYFQISQLEKLRDLSTVNVKKFNQENKAVIFNKIHF